MMLGRAIIIIIVITNRLFLFVSVRLYMYVYQSFCCCLFLGDCISRFTNRKVAYCIKFHPEEDKQHFFVAGTADKKIVCVSYVFL